MPRHTNDTSSAQPLGAEPAGRQQCLPSCQDDDEAATVRRFNRLLAMYWPKVVPAPTMIPWMKGTSSSFPSHSTLVPCNSHIVA